MRVLLASAAMAFLAVAPCQARVFDRWRTGAQSDRALETAGGRLIYESDVRINNGAGRLAVFGFLHPPQKVMDDLESAFGKRFSRSGTDGGTATIRDDGRVLKLIVLSPSPGGQTVVFKLAHTESEYVKAQAPPAAQVPAYLPAYPGAEIDSVMVNQDTAATLVAASTSAAAAAVQAYYETALRAAGWSLAPPAPREDGDSMRIYVRGAELCCVLASRSEGTGATRITVLHKRHGVK